MTPVNPAPTSEATVSILTVVFNKVEYTRQCLETLYRNTDPALRFEVIVVDNASSDETSQYLKSARRQFPNLQVVRNAENLGFVGGNNVGAVQARGRYLCFLNNDTEVAPGWLEPVLGMLEADPSIGAVGSKLIYPDGRLQEAGGIIFNDASGVNFGRFDHPDNPEYSFVRDVDYCSGAALTVRTELFRALGGFDERYAPAYFEDADLCFAIREQGYRVVYNHESEVVHHEGITSGTDLNAGFKRFQVINRPKFFEKWRHRLVEQPEPGQGVHYLRSVGDRRSRGGRQVLFGSTEMQQHDRQGGAYRFINMLKLLLEAGHHITYFACNTCWREPDVDLEPYVFELRRLGVAVYRLDISVHGNKIAPSTQAVERIVTGRDFDAALLLGGFDSRSYLYAIAQASPGTRIVVDSVDLAFLREGRLNAKTHAPRQWTNYRSRKLAELGTYKHADAVLTVTEREREVLDRELGPGKSFHMPDLYPAPPSVPGYNDRSGLVFLAGFRHSPNLDAVRYLLDQIMPLVRARLPGVVLTLVGDSPPEWLQERADEHTLVTGYVPDLQPYLQSARVALAPITWGAGIKGKICQAMASGAPNVVTSMAAEGMDLRDGAEVLLSDSPEDFAQAVVRIYQDQELWSRLSEGGRNWVQARHSKPVVTQRLDQVMFPGFAANERDTEGAAFESVAEGYEALRDGRFRRGIEVFQQAAARFPHFAEAHLGLGRALLSVGQYAEAVEAMQRALAYTENPLAVHIAIADLLRQAGRFDAAAQVLEAALRDADEAHEHFEAARELLDIVRNGSMPSYRLWRERQQTSDADRAAIQDTVAAWDDDAKVHLFVSASADDQANLGDMLDALGAQLCARWTLTVVSNRPSPHPLFDTLEPLRWVQVDGVPEDAIPGLAPAGSEDWIGVLQVGDILHPRAVFACLAESKAHAQWQLLYTDEDRLSQQGFRYDPRFKPDFNLELLRSTPYIGQLALVRGTVLKQLGCAPARASLWSSDLAFRVVERFGEAAIGHVPDVLIHRARESEDSSKDGAFRELVKGHLARAGVRARIEPGLVAMSNRVEYLHDDAPMVSIIIPTKDRRALLAACVESVLKITSYANFEVLVVDNGSSEQDAVEYLGSLPARDARVKVLSFPHPYNFSTMNNFAAGHAGGDYFLLLNNDTEVIEPDWLQQMMAQAQREDVGVVGCRLLYADRRVQHAGVVLGIGHNGVGEHPFAGLSPADAGHMGRAQVAQEYSAVTGACLLIRKDVFEEIGGLDQQHLAVLYNDLDLCLKAKRAGYRVIWTPFATLIHHCGASLQDGHYKDPAKMEQARHEASTMLERWLPTIANDPAYNRNLTLLRTDFSCDTDVGATWDRNVRVGPRLMGLGFGSDGSHAHRVVYPLQTLARQGRAQTGLIPKYKDRVRVPNVAELQRAAPDAVLFHNAVHDAHLAAIDNFRRFTDVPLIFGQDDLMVDLPDYNEFRNTIYPDMKQRLRRAMSACDRLVVTTEPLADAYRKWANEVRVVPNYLDGQIWRGLSSQRRRDQKPRVGWAGAQQHNGDLNVLFDVVRQTADKVQWVFFGLCFEEWLNLGVEVHNPVQFEDYPAALAALDLDLAVAPLVQNRFNQCKSNLKVLEYGALGFPVVCTDIEPYRNAPVTRVKNRTADWVEAILERATDLDQAAREGDALRRWVHEHWMLEQHLDEWLAALSPSAEAMPTAKAGAT